jgi:hypothetical protein
MVICFITLAPGGDGITVRSYTNTNSFKNFLGKSDHNDVR